MTWKVPLFKMYSDESDVEAVSRVVKRATFWADGPDVKEFESNIAKHTGTKYALTFNSGTSALHALLVAYGVEGSEVIVPSFTFVSTATCVLMANATPVFVEAEPDTFGIDIDDVKKKITDKTKAIIQIHYSGFPGRDTLALKELAKEKGLIFIEDAAESMGAKLNGQMIGSIGDSAMLSFCQNKIIATGEGGALVMDDEALYQKCKLIRSHGRLEDGNDYFSSTGDNDYIQLGYNFRLGSVLAALGNSQLNKVDKMITMRRTLGKKFDDFFSEGAKKEFVSLPKQIENSFVVYQMYPILLSSNEIKQKMQAFMTDKGIMTKTYFNPAHLKSLYMNNFGYKEGDLPITEDISSRILSLPFYPGMPEEESDYLLASMEEFFTTLR